MASQSDNLLAGLTGAASAALWWWNENQNDTEERLRSSRAAIASTHQRLDALFNSADFQRLLAPIVRDLVIGWVAATPASQPAVAVPPIGTAVQRPDLSAGLNISSLAWPPQAGSYDATGRTTQAGELAALAYTLTYQEPRAFLQGLTQSRPPQAQQQMQLFLAAQGLSQVITAKALDGDAWTAVWASVLSGSPAFTGGLPPMDPHADPSQPPVATPALTGGKVVPLTPAGIPNYAYHNPQTDAANQWRYTAPAGGNNPGDLLFHVSFRTEYRTAAGPFQPIVFGNPAHLAYPTNVTHAGFDVKALVPLGASVSVDFSFLVTSGKTGG